MAEQVRSVSALLQKGSSYPYTKLSEAIEYYEYKVKLKIATKMQHHLGRVLKRYALTLLAQRDDQQRIYDMYGTLAIEVKKINSKYPHGL